MQFLTVLCTICTILPVFAGPTSLPISVSIDIPQGEKAGGHIVRLEEGASRGDIISKVNALLAGKSSDLGVTHEYDAVFNGFAGKFDQITLAAMQIMPGVKAIEEDGMVHTTAVETQTDAPWGLARLSSKASQGTDAGSLSYTYTYDSAAGTGVDIYIIDTGIRISHQDFGGRAKWAYTAPTAGLPLVKIDGHGHGTHCAGTAAGGQYGVAKKAMLHAVKVLNDAGAGRNSDVISGMDFVVSQKRATGKPTVASMSLGGGASPAVDDAAKRLVAANVHLVVAAGNDDKDADAISPARVREAITVGASDIADQRASFSNFGPAVDVFAPGVDVISTWNLGDEATKSLSGTSMATPHIAGLVAYLLSIGDPTITPNAMSKIIRDLALKDVLNGISAGTVNLLANNGVQE